MNMTVFSHKGDSNWDCKHSQGGRVGGGGGIDDGTEYIKSFGIVYI